VWSGETGPGVARSRIGRREREKDSERLALALRLRLRMESMLRLA
jgi:hypothetical protein